MKTLSIIIPTFNEEKTVKILLEKVNNVKLPSKITKEIIVIDDHSNDATARILKSIKNIEFKYILQSKNLGKGIAVRVGISRAKGDFIIIQDADLEYNPQDYSKLMQPILNEGAEVVYGNRFENYPLRIWGKNQTVLPFHWISNIILAAMTNILYGSNLRDMETCYKLFTKKALNSLNLKSKRFEIEPEITAKILKKGYKIYEVPIKVSPRTYEEGKKIGWKDGIIAVWTLIKYRFVD